MDISRLSPAEKIGEAIRRSKRFLPGEASALVDALLKPETLLLVSGTLAVWVGSHLFGVGQIVDCILLGVGVVSLGFAVFEGAGELYEFARKALGARTEPDLVQAGQHFAKAVTILGISTVQALLMRGQASTAISRGRPALKPRIVVGDPPPAGNQLRISKSPMSGALGSTDAYGVIVLARGQSLTEQKITLLHELVHRYLSPRTGPLRRLRAELNLAGYTRSAWLRYLEEALAEGYAQLRVNGVLEAIKAFRFPVEHGYVSVSRLANEAGAIGTIVLGGLLFQVSILLGQIPDR